MLWVTMIVFDSTCYKLPIEREVANVSKIQASSDTIHSGNDLHGGGRSLHVFLLEYRTKNRRYEKYLDLVKWLNGEENYLKNQ